MRLEYFVLAATKSGGILGAQQVGQASEVGPPCPNPNCGGTPLVKRYRKSDGHPFWGCPNYPRCRGSLDIASDTDAMGEGDSELGSLIARQRTVVAQPLRVGMDTVYFESMTVHFDSLGSNLPNDDTDSRPAGTQWRMSYQPRGFVPSAELGQALSVVDKILTRGRITPLSSSLESALAVLPTPRVRPYDTSFTPQPSLDSSAEGVMYEQVLPSLLGEGYSRWVVPQIEIVSLTGSDHFDQTEQRVDFLVSHPNIERPLIVEVDGSQHADSKEKDQLRDQHLQEAGYEVVRISVSALESGDHDALAHLESALSGAKTSRDYEEDLVNPIRRAGQIQTALLQLVYAGILSVESGRPTVSSDLVRSGDIPEHSFRAILDDFSELVSRVGRMHGLNLLPEGLAVAGSGSPPSVDLCFYSGKGSESPIYIEDVHLPFSVRWQPRRASHAERLSLTEDDATYFLERVFRKPSFWDGQYEIVDRVMGGKDTIALLPTGAGKSIAFQLATMLLPGRTIIVAPIKSLINDQIDNLRKYGIDRSLGITSQIKGSAARDMAYEALANGDAFFCYITPHRFQSKKFREILRGMTPAYPVNAIVIDEAHCVSEWGHSFMTAYLRIGQTSRECSRAGSWVPPLIALTGTASQAVLRDLQRELQISDPDAIVTPSSFDRPELHYKVLLERSEHKLAALVGEIKSVLPSVFGVPPETFFALRGKDTFSGIVFCPFVNGENGVAGVQPALSKAGIRSSIYAGGAPKGWSDSDWEKHKRQVEKAFKLNQVQTLVATKAYGMGIDKQNIRWTIHLGIPPSIEAFYQETGRAGRDGSDAMCVVVVSDDNPRRNQELLAPAADLSHVNSLLEGTRRSDSDDIDRILFLHTKEFRGDGPELETVVSVLEEIGETGRQKTVVLSFGPDKDGREKALHRLVVVGLVADYTVDYSAREFLVVLQDADRESVIESYVAYVAGYHHGPAAQQRADAERLPEEWTAFTRGILKQYILFVYEVIERNRRRAIAEMLDACKSGSGEDLRARALAYLQKTEFSELLDSVLASKKWAGMDLIPEAAANVQNSTGAAALRGAVSRQLESYADHPGLLAVRALAEALADDGYIEAVVDNYRAMMISASTKYNVPRTALNDTTAALIKRVYRSNPMAAASIESAFIESGADRSELRDLVEMVGVGNLSVVPWYMLHAIESEVRDMAHSSSREET